MLVTERCVARALPGLRQAPVMWFWRTLTSLWVVSGFLGDAPKDETAKEPTERAHEPPVPPKLLPRCRVGALDVSFRHHPCTLGSGMEGKVPGNFSVVRLVKRGKVLGFEAVKAATERPGLSDESPDNAVRRILLKQGENLVGPFRVQPNASKKHQETDSPRVSKV